MQPTNLSDFLNAILEQFFMSVSLVLSEISKFAGDLLRLIL